MTDEEFIFNETNRERAKMKSGALHKKNGSKSKKCTLPSDGLTKREREKLNGPVISIKMDQPYRDWQQFRNLPKSMQVEYLQNCVDKYGARAIDIADMFGIQKATVFYYYGKSGNVKCVEFKNKGSRGMRDSWKEFINCDKKEDTSKLDEEVKLNEPRSDIYTNVLSSGAFTLNGSRVDILDFLDKVMNSENAYELKVILTKKLS